MSAINKAFEVLDLFLNCSEPIGVTEAAKLTGVNPTTTYRIISSLVKCGYLEQLSKRGKYSISSKKLIAFSNIIMARLKVRNTAMPFLQELSTITNESTQIALRLGNVAFNADIIYANRMLNVRPTRENTIPLYSTAVGKIFLAQMSDQEFQIYSSNVPLEPRTPHTITDAARLKEQIVKIRKEGVSCDIEEQEPGIASMAAPVKDPKGNVVAAISVIVPTIRFDGSRTAELARFVKETAVKISLAMQHTERYPSSEGLYVTEFPAGSEVPSKNN